MDAQAEALLEVWPRVRDVAAYVPFHLPVIRDESAQELEGQSCLHSAAELIVQQANMGFTSLQCK